jgi:hypothetical protein
MQLMVGFQEILSFGIRDIGRACNPATALPSIDVGGNPSLKSSVSHIAVSGGLTWSGLCYALIPQVLIELLNL